MLGSSIHRRWRSSETQCSSNESLRLLLRNGCGTTPRPTGAPYLPSNDFLLWCAAFTGPEFLGIGMNGIGLA